MYAGGKDTEASARAARVKERRGLERSQPFGGWWRRVNGGGRERRWSGQLRHYIPNRKRDKANKTLSGRRSANRALSSSARREEERDEAQGGEGEGRPPRASERDGEN